MEQLPAEDLQNIALNLKPQEISNLCLSSSDLNAKICNDLSFLRQLARKYLTIESLMDPLTENILMHIIYIQEGLNLLDQWNFGEGNETKVEDYLDTETRNSDGTTTWRMTNYIANRIDQWTLAKGRDLTLEEIILLTNSVILMCKNGYELAITKFIALIFGKYRYVDLPENTFNKILSKLYSYVSRNIVIRDYPLNNPDDIIAVILSTNNQVVALRKLLESEIMEVSIPLDGEYRYPADPNVRFPFILLLLMIAITDDKYFDVVKYLIDLFPNAHIPWERYDLPFYKSEILRYAIMNQSMRNLTYFLDTPSVFKNVIFNDDIIFYIYQYSNSLANFRSVIKALNINLDYLIYTIPYIRYNTNDANIEILKYLLSLYPNKDILKDKIYWEQPAINYDPTIHNIDNKNISKIASEMINLRLANPQVILLNI
jgi:hypothetical protein